MIDPTLLINKKVWEQMVSNINELEEEKYILAYFLDVPSEIALKIIKQLQEKYSCKIICIPYKHSEFNFSNFKYLNGVGPLEFIWLVKNASFVCTDSFHGTAFSINLNKNFLTFKRNYGSATDQSSRIITLLKKLCLQDRFVSEFIENDFNLINDRICFEKSNQLLENERKKSKKYLINAFTSIQKKENNGV